MTNVDHPPQVSCPTCGRRTPFTSANRWRPFCGERCRSIDLGAWASERFRVPASLLPSDADEDTDAGPLDPRPPGA